MPGSRMCTVIIVLKTAALNTRVELDNECDFYLSLIISIYSVLRSLMYGNFESCRKLPRKPSTRLVECVRNTTIFTFRVIGAGAIGDAYLRRVAATTADDTHIHEVSIVRCK